MAKKKSDVKSVAITYALDQYLKRVKPNIHLYTCAFIEPEFRGIMKTDDEWAEVLEQYKENKV